MVFMRRRPLLRAAAVGGAGYLAGKGRARRQADQQSQEASQDQRISSLERQAASTQAAVPGSSGPAGGTSITDQLGQLTDMHAQGTLSDAEFAAAKAKLLGT